MSAYLEALGDTILRHRRDSYRRLARYLFGPIHPWDLRLVVFVFCSERHIQQQCVQRFTEES